MNKRLVILTALTCWLTQIFTLGAEWRIMSKSLTFPGNPRCCFEKCTNRSANVEDESKRYQSGWGKLEKSRRQGQPVGSMMQKYKTLHLKWRPAHVCLSVPSRGIHHPSFPASSFLLNWHFNYFLPWLERVTTALRGKEMSVILSSN